MGMLQPAGPAPAVVPAAASSRPVLAVERRLIKGYGDLLAVDGMSFEVAEAEVLSHGLNGARRPAFRVLTGRALPWAGRAPIAGFDVHPETSRIRPPINPWF